MADEWALIPVVFIERPFRFTRDRLSLSGTFSPYFSQPSRDFQGLKSKIIVGYEFSQYIKAKLIYTEYSGGDSDDLFGSYRDYDNLGVELEYEF